MASDRIDWEAIGRNPRASAAILGGTVLLGLIISFITLFTWMRLQPEFSIQLDVPGRDGFDAEALAKANKVDLAGVFQKGDGVPSQIKGDWTAFRGADGLNVVTGGPPLADAWPEGGPKVLWKIPVGDGYASPVVLNGAVYLMDYDVEKRADAMRCLSLDDGREIWRRAYGNNIKRNHGMSRTIPAVTPEYLVAMGPKCHVVCLDTATGDFRWGYDLIGDYGTVEPLWYTGQCPIIDNDKAIIAPCGKDVLMMGIDCKTGEILWKIPNPREWNMSHSSVVLMTVLGKRMYVYNALGGMVAVSADPATEGQLLFDIPWDAKVIAPSPVKAGEDLIFCTTGYGRGSRMLRLKDEGGKIAVEVVYDKPPSDILACEQQTPIFYDGQLYGIMPKDGGSLKGQLVCFNPDGSLVWSSGNDHRFGLGPFLLADNKFFILDDEGELTMSRVVDGKYERLGYADVLEGHDAWGPLTLAGSRLIVRDLQSMACIELGKS